MSRNYTFAPGEYYHIYARGFNKNKTFLDSNDYDRFQKSLFLMNTESQIVWRDIIRSKKYSDVYIYDKGTSIVAIGVYGLMPNHFHILVREISEGGISKFMQKLMTSYTMYFNKKYDRTGGLFGSSFKAVHVANDNHLKYLFSYIHINPDEILGAGTRNTISKIEDLKDYKYASFIDYLGTDRPESLILNKEVFPGYFNDSDILSEVKEWIELKY